MDWRSEYQHALEWVRLFIQEAMAGIVWAAQWASETGNRNLVGTIVALIGVPSAILGCILFVKRLRGKGLDQVVDQTHSIVKSNHSLAERTHSIVERLHEKSKQTPETTGAVSHKVEHTTEHIMGRRTFKREDGSTIEIEPTPQMRDLEERIIGVKEKK